MVRLSENAAGTTNAASAAVVAYRRAVKHPPSLNLLTWVGPDAPNALLNYSTFHEPATLWTVITTGIIKMNPCYSGNFIMTILELFVS